MDLRWRTREVAFTAFPALRFDVMRRFSQVRAAFLRLVVVAGPVLLGLLTAVYIARPSTFFLAPGAMLAVAVIVCDAWIIARRHWITGSLALTTQIAFLIFVGTYMASPLPAPPPLSDPLPPASPPFAPRTPYVPAFPSQSRAAAELHARTVPKRCIRPAHRRTERA